MLKKVYSERTSITLRIDIHKKTRKFHFHQQKKHNLHKALTLGGFSRVEDEKKLFMYSRFS